MVAFAVATGTKGPKPFGAPVAAADALPDAKEIGEERGLAGIRVPQQHNRDGAT